MTPLEARERYDACAKQQGKAWKQIAYLESEKLKLLDVITGKEEPTPGRLCDECNIIEIETKLWDVEQELKDAKEATLATAAFIRKFVAEHPLDGSCPFDKMNSDECLNIRDGQCEVCVVDHAIDSLRTAQRTSAG
jgi:hypothetical protein